MMNSVFLSYPEVPYLNETLTALEEFGLPTERIEETFRVISNLIPGTLQRGAESWLIFFQPDRQQESDRQQELLILPFPDKRNSHQWLENELNLRGYLAELIPTLNRCFEGEPPYIPPEWIGRFQYIRPNLPLRYLLRLNERRLNERDIGQNRRLAQRIQNVLQKTSQTIQQQRSEILREFISTRDPSLLTELDDKFLRENNKLFYKLLYQSRDVEVVPPIVQDFEDIIDPETRRFLITSETVREFAYDYLPDNFDYSAPGCGLWKAVERTLNLSLVLHLRMKARRGPIVEDIEAPLRGSSSREGEQEIIPSVSGSPKVNINLREAGSSNKLRGVELGSMQNMLQWGHNNGIKSKLKHLFPTNTTMQQYFVGSKSSENIADFEKWTLPWHLEDLRKLRNGHAHISAMSREQFEELRELVLPSDDHPDSCLVKILQLRRKVVKPEWIRKVCSCINSIRQQKSA